MEIETVRLTCQALETLDTKCHEIITNVNDFMESIFKWAKEVQGIVEKEISTKSQTSNFRLPKTPSEKTFRSQRTKNALVSSTALNSTMSLDEVQNNLDNTRSTRTRAARRALTSKMSQLNVTTDKQMLLPVDVKQEIVEAENLSKMASLRDETFVVPNTASTRTKPVVRKKKQKQEASPDTEKTVVVNGSERTSGSAPEESSDESDRKKVKVSRVASKSPVERKTRSKISRTQSETVTVGNRESKSIFSRGHSESSAKPATPHEVSPDLPKSPPIHLSSSKVSSPVPVPTRQKISRALSESPVKRPSKFSKTFCKNVGDELSANKSPGTVVKSPEARRDPLRTPSQSPIPRSSELGTPGGFLRSSSIKPVKTPGPSPILRKSRSLGSAAKTVESQRTFVQDPTITNGTMTMTAQGSPSKAAATFVVANNEDGYATIGMDYEKTPTALALSKLMSKRKTSTPMSGKEKTLIFDSKLDEPDEICNQTTIKPQETECTVETSPTEHEEPVKEPAKEPDENAAPKRTKRRKVKKESQEKVADEYDDTVRITRTKSKAIKEMIKEGNVEVKQQQDMSFAKKLLNRAKMTSLKRKQLAALLEGTPQNRPVLAVSNMPGGGSSTKAKYLLLSSSKKLKTPLATLPNSTVKKPKTSDYKNRMKVNGVKRDSSGENRSASKTVKKNKEDEATKNREKVMKSKQEELKRKNELKHQLAMKQREKLEQEKYQNMIQSEREKEERHKLILQERQMRMKEEALKKKILTQQKIAETMERRRLEEEARIAKLKEQEAEEQRIALEKQREQERQEKRAQERLALMKAQEKYEMKLRQEEEAERLRAEKASLAKKYLSSASKMQSASKKPRFGLLGERKEWDYKKRNEDDYGLEDEHSEDDSDEEPSYDNSKPTPAWASRVMKLQRVLNAITLDMVCEYMPCNQKTPDIQKMFNMTPTRRIKRTSSAIWNTPTST